VAEAIEQAFGREIDIRVYRRNITIAGVNLCELIGKQFYVGEVLFEGVAHCNPCTWMDAVIAKGTYRLMKGRGGLRAKVLEVGNLSLGKVMLQTDTILTKEPAEAMILSRLPKGL
jgi:MOSC domain-containing protein YiiM